MNHYRSRVASGQEPLGSPGPQPQATNMAELVSDPLGLFERPALNGAHGTPSDWRVVVVMNVEGVRRRGWRALWGYLGGWGSVEVSRDLILALPQMWSTELARVAQAWANQCEDHGDCAACRSTAK